MILNRDPNQTMTVHTERKIKKKADVCVRIVAEPADKIYKVCFLKRRRLGDNTTLPFGYLHVQPLHGMYPIKILVIHIHVKNLQNVIHHMDVYLNSKHAFTSVISGPTGFGNTTFSVKFLKNLDSQCTDTEFSGGIILCYSEKTAVPYKELIKLKKNTISGAVA